jgi:hypothetical protein
MIDKIIPYVKSGSTEPFIVHRDKNGGWHCDNTQNQYGEGFDWVDSIIRKKTRSLSLSPVQTSPMAVFPMFTIKYLQHGFERNTM